MGVGAVWGGGSLPGHQRPPLPRSDKTCPLPGTGIYLGSQL